MNQSIINQIDELLIQLKDTDPRKRPDKSLSLAYGLGCMCDSRHLPADCQDIFTQFVGSVILMIERPDVAKTMLKDAFTNGMNAFYDASQHKIKKRTGQK